jgi:hypothetical protein
MHDHWAPYNVSVFLDNGNKIILKKHGLRWVGINTVQYIYILYTV